MVFFKFSLPEKKGDPSFVVTGKAVYVITKEGIIDSVKMPKRITEDVLKNKL